MIGRKFRKTRGWHKVGASWAQAAAQVAAAQAASKLSALNNKKTNGARLVQGWCKVGARLAQGWRKGSQTKIGLELGHGRHETQRAKCCTTVVSNLSLDHSSQVSNRGGGPLSIFSGCLGFGRHFVEHHNELCSVSQITGLVQDWHKVGARFGASNFWDDTVAQ